MIAPETIGMVDAYEPMRQFRFLFNHPHIAQHCVRSVAFEDNLIKVRFHDEVNSKNLQTLIDNKKAFPDHRTTLKLLSTAGEVITKVDLGYLDLLSAQPLKLDYSENSPIEFEAVFKRQR